MVTFRPMAALLVLAVNQVVEEPDHNLGMVVIRSLAAVVAAVSVAALVLPLTAVAVVLLEIAQIGGALLILFQASC